MGMEPSQISVVFGVVTLLVVVLAAVVWLVRRQHQKQKRAQGVIWLQALRSMLMHIQRHRGLTTTVLGGDVTLVGKLEEAQRNVSRDLGHIALVGDWIKDNPNWEAITAHWARLAGQYQRLDARKNLDQHNKLIKGILVFIDDVAIEHYLVGARLDDVSWRFVLAVVEQLGQIRAVGLAYIASLERSESAPRLRNALQVLMEEFSSTSTHAEYSRFLTDAHRHKIQQFLTAFPLALLENPKACPLQSYYQTATGVIDELYLQFDDQLQSSLAVIV
ncbi:hypothetical protein MARGE09_P1494 [Marinagarivorans cellulosilyticus]|uniref:Nitrate/nitrite sensing protein domain-containing protein n=2 Tax=Marinagarivorans cellulosilyticus TaxID=2721545 RepID=A0AAN2BJS1_9GAMM|nr:hypothetical protein MARGE09_P1494 [Marinagarivorans cellulosilyticus]